MVHFHDFKFSLINCLRTYEGGCFTADARIQILQPGKVEDIWNKVCGWAGLEIGMKNIFLKKINGHEVLNSFRKDDYFCPRNSLKVVYLLGRKF